MWSHVFGMRYLETNNPNTYYSLHVTAGSNVESVAEDEAMRCLILIRNFIEGYQQARSHALSKRLVLRQNTCM